MVKIDKEEESLAETSLRLREFRLRLREERYKVLEVKENSHVKDR